MSMETRTQRWRIPRAVRRRARVRDHPQEEETVADFMSACGHGGGTGRGHAAEASTHSSGRPAQLRGSRKRRERESALESRSPVGDALSRRATSSR